MVRLDIYPQRPEEDAVLRLVEIKRITESGVIENPRRLTATSGEDQQEIPFPVANSAHLTAAFEGKAPAGSTFEFKIGLLVGNQEINMDFKAERLGDKKGIEPWRIAPGGVWPWFRYVLGLD